MSAASQLLWAGVAAQLGVPAAGGEAARAPIQQRRRRGAHPHAADGRAAVRLLRDGDADRGEHDAGSDGGLLRWVYEPPARQAFAAGRRSWRSFSAASRETVQRIAFPELAPNRLTEALQALDWRLNPLLGPPAGAPPGRPPPGPVEGLRRWRAGGWAPLATGELAGLQGRVLVLVHGTFSASAMYAKEFAATVEGQALFERLNDASGTYAAVLAFDHPTLSVAPWLNALALRDALAPCRAEFDFVAHSRGGLVVSWLLRLAPGLRARQALFVGAPLGGTSLAAPDKLRQALDLLASFADAVARSAPVAGRAAPPGLDALALGVAGLACVLGRVLQLGSRMPLADAAVGLVPGLLAQGRVTNNLELAQLYPLPTGTEVRAIGGSFMPDEANEPLWKFWRRVTHLKGQAMYWGADLVFDQPNDLVVDTASMHSLGDAALAASHWEDLGTSPRTHHCNYFQDGRVLTWLDGRLR